MGRRCGYLAVMSAIATGRVGTLIPESPPDFEHEDWQARMCEVLRSGLKMGRRDNIVIVAEGAQDRHGNPITSEYVRQALRTAWARMSASRCWATCSGGSPTAYDRILSTIMGVEAVDAVLSADPATDSLMIGIQNNKVVRLPLMECVKKTLEINAAIKSGDYDKAMQLRGRSFRTVLEILRTLTLRRMRRHRARSGCASA